METTTTDGGVANAAQPDETSVAVNEDDEGAQVISTDENGTPALTASEVQEEAEAPSSADEAVTETKEVEETQADSDEDIVAWTEKKGLKIDPKNPNEVKLARMQLEAERKMHEATQVKSEVQPPEELPLSPTDENYNRIADRQNRLEQMNYVRDWFASNPEAAKARDELQKIAADRPWLTNLDDVYAHHLADPQRAAGLKREGGKEALTNLAQKQQAIPPTSGATNTGSYQSQEITPATVYDLVDRNDQEWFEKNHDAISKAMGA